MQSRKPNNMQPSLDQTSTHQYIISFQRSGSKVWIKSFRKVWIGGLDRRSGSCVGTGLDPDLTFWAAAIYIYMIYTCQTKWIMTNMMWMQGGMESSIYLKKKVNVLHDSRLCWIRTAATGMNDFNCQGTPAMVARDLIHQAWDFKGMKNGRASIFGVKRSEAFTFFYQLCCLTLDAPTQAHDRATLQSNCMVLRLPECRQTIQATGVGWGNSFPRT